MQRALMLMFIPLALGVLSCDKGTRGAASSAEPVPAAPAPPASESATPTLKKRMTEHFTKAAAMKNAVIHGDVATLKKEADWMAKHELSQAPDNWRSHMQAMHTAAQHAVDAKDLDSAAQAVAEMGAACGSCHKALGGPKLEPGTPPAEGSGAALHMIRHQWAADRMWDGLIGPSDTSWAKGADVLADAPLTERALNGEKSIPPEVELFAQKVHSYGAKGRDAKAAARASLYGEFLATCAGCHGKVGVK